MSLLDPLRMHWDIWECIFLHVAISHSFYGSFLPIMLAFQVQGNYRSCTFFSAIFQRTESPILEAPSTSAGCQKWDVKHMYGILSSLCHPEQGRAPDDGKFFQGRGRYSGVGKVVKELAWKEWNRWNIALPYPIHCVNLQSPTWRFSSLH